MQRLIARSCLAILAGIALACGGAGSVNGPTGPPPPSPPGATIKGVLTSADVSSTAFRSTTRAGVRGIRVSVVGTNRSTVTDAAGWFEMAAVRPGATSLAFDGPGARGMVELGDITDNSVVVVAVFASGGTVDLVDRRKHDLGDDIGEDPTDDDPMGEAEIRGTIDSVSSPVIVVDGTRVVTDAATAIWIGKVPASLGALEAGDLVEVEGTLLGDGSIQARKVKVEDEDGDDDNGGDDDGGDNDDDGSGDD